MILKNLRLFSQNVWKNKLLTDTVLEINKDFNIILIQESLWSTIWSIPSSTSKEDKTCPIIQIRLSFLEIYQIIWKDIFNYKNIFLFFLFQ